MNDTTQYEGTIGNYIFRMKEDDVIEVWNDITNEFPESYIYLKPGSQLSEKDFQKEISFWYIGNVSNQ